MGGFGVESFLSGEQHPADPVERVVAAAAVAFLFALHAAADLVEGPVGQLHAVKRVHDLVGAGQHHGVDRGVGVRHVQGTEADAVFPGVGLPVDPAGDVDIAFGWAGFR